MFIVPRYLLRCGPVGLDTVRRTAQCCSRCFLIVENALASSQNALANIQNALASSENAVANSENALVNGENAPANGENAIVNGEIALQNSENACRNGTKRIPSPIVLQVLFFLKLPDLGRFGFHISGHSPAVFVGILNCRI